MIIKFFEVIGKTFLQQTASLGTFLQEQTNQKNTTTNLQLIDKLTELMSKRQSAPAEYHTIYDEAIMHLREMLANGGAVPKTMSQPPLTSQSLNTSNSLSLDSQLLQETQGDDENHLATI